MPNLILHCGAQNVERHEIECVRSPKATRTHQPIDHFGLLSLVEYHLSNNDLMIRNQAHALTPNGDRYFGMLEIAPRHDQDYAMVVGIRNSHDKRFPAGLVVGSVVCVCDNLSFSGEITLARKHTRHILRDLPLLVQQAMASLMQMGSAQDQRIETYKRKRVTNKSAHDLLIQAVDIAALPVTALPTAIREWREPSHDEFTEDGQSAWRLFNAMTEAVKGRSLEALPSRTQRIHQLMDHACGLN